MPPIGSNEHRELKRLIEENTKLTRENNVLLRKLHRNSVIGNIMRVVWYGLLIGLPFALYFYLLEPYFVAMGSNYEIFRQGIEELPGLKGIGNLIQEERQ